jgi:hypothetical protein
VSPFPGLARPLNRHPHYAYRLISQIFSRNLPMICAAARCHVARYTAIGVR